MRRALRHALPGFALHFGIRPWEVDDLAYGEIELFVDALVEIARKNGG